VEFEDGPLSSENTTKLARQWPFSVREATFIEKILCVTKMSAKRDGILEKFLFVGSKALRLKLEFDGSVQILGSHYVPRVLV